MGEYNISAEELINRINAISQESTQATTASSGSETSVGLVARYLNQFRAGTEDGRVEFYDLKKMLLPDGHLSPDVPASGKKEILALGEILLKDYISKVEQNIESVVLIVPESSILEAKGSASVLIWSEPLYKRKVSEVFTICPDAHYAQQRSAFALGTGFFIKKNVVATAAHVLVGNGTDIEKIRFVHGFRLKQAGDFENHIIVHKSQVFRPSRVAGKLPDHHFEFFVDSSDWALVEVTNAYEGYRSVDVTPVARAHRRQVRVADLVYAVGHGLGLPVKVSFDGVVKEGSMRSTYYETSLTLLGGNSGSPVFFADTHELAGIYMRGVKKLHLKKGSDHCLEVRNEDLPIEGQECQVLDPVYQALDQYF